MRMRFTRCLGLSVFDDDTGDTMGALRGILLHPDTGAVEGFFVRGLGMFPGADRFLGSLDILHWGTRITVRSADVLTPIEERVRLLPLLESGRPILGQSIVTRGGTALGRCADVQFETEHYRLEWIFPRRFFRWGIPIPASQILEVKRDAVIVRDPPAAEVEEDVALVPPMPEAA